MVWPLSSLYIDGNMELYIDGNMQLSTVQEEKDLGVFFTSDLKASTQCTKSAAKARRIIGMVRRNFKRLDKNDLYIRPHLEYCIQAWSPHLMKDIQCLKRVQKSATNLIPDTSIKEIQLYG